MKVTVLVVVVGDSPVALLLALCDVIVFGLFDDDGRRSVEHFVIFLDGERGESWCFVKCKM